MHLRIHSLVWFTALGVLDDADAGGAIALTRRRHRLIFRAMSGRSWPTIASSAMGRMTPSGRRSCGSICGKRPMTSAVPRMSSSRGNPNDSELIARVTSDDPDVRMPPADSGKTLTPEQIETLRTWVAQGAEYKQHWAFVAPGDPMCRR